LRTWPQSKTVFAKQVGVRQIITIGIDLPTSRRAIELAEANGEIYATIGIHPHNACALSSKDYQELLSLGHKSQVVAYGEIGLDFYRNYKPRPVQISCLHEQLNVARQLGLPVVIHDREAHEEVLQILREQNHCKKMFGSGLLSLNRRSRDFC
jgi:TatD DNase family protein